MTCQNFAVQRVCRQPAWVQAGAAERYKALSDRIRLAEARLVFARWRDAAKAADAARAQASAAEAQVTYQQAKEIFPRNAQDHCFDGPYYAASHDRWLVLAQNGLQWEMQQAVIRDGRVMARRGIGRFFIKQLDLSLLPRKVKAATIYTRLNNGHMSEYSFRLDGKRWHWIEWGASEFYLEQAAHRWVIGQSDQVSAGKMLVPGRAEVPPAMRALPFVERDLYEPGNMVLHWAGDLNGDGLPEFITYRQIKEAWGTLLWSAVRSATGGITVKVIAEGSDGCS